LFFSRAAPRERRTTWPAEEISKKQRRLDGAQPACSAILQSGPSMSTIVSHRSDCVNMAGAELWLRAILFGTEFAHSSHPAQVVLRNLVERA